MLVSVIAAIRAAISNITITIFVVVVVADVVGGGSGGCGVSDSVTETKM